MCSSGHSDHLMILLFYDYVCNSLKQFNVFTCFLEDRLHCISSFLYLSYEHKIPSPRNSQLVVITWNISGGLYQSEP